jgi:hypothetical protein
MKKIILITSCIALSACSTITKGSTQTVAISTPGVENALCTLESPAIGQMTVKTPDTVMIEKSKHDIHVTCEKACYETASGTIPSNFENMTFGNIIFGGVIGVAVDAGTGALNKYEPSISIAMKKHEECDHYPDAPLEE